MRCVRCPGCRSPRRRCRLCDRFRRKSRKVKENPLHTNSRWPAKMCTDEKVARWGRRRVSEGRGMDRGEGEGPAASGERRGAAVTFVESRIMRKGREGKEGRCQGSWLSHVIAHSRTKAERATSSPKHPPNHRCAASSAESAVDQEWASNTLDPSSGYAF